MQLDLFITRDRHGWTLLCPGCGKGLRRNIWHRWEDRTIWHWDCIDTVDPEARGRQFAR